MAPRYKPLQYLGALVILGGVTVVLLPKFLKGSSTGDNDPLFNIIFFMSDIPQAFSSVYKEIAFANDVPTRSRTPPLRLQDLDIYYLQAWVALFQFLIGLALIWINVLPVVGGMSCTPPPPSTSTQK
jgi:hypothetical protein